MIIRDTVIVWYYTFGYDTPWSLVLEEVVGDFVVHEQKDYEMKAHVVLERVIGCGVTSCLTCAKRASRERTQRAHAQGR